MLVAYSPLFPLCVKIIVPVKFFLLDWGNSLGIIWHRSMIFVNKLMSIRCVVPHSAHSCVARFCWLIGPLSISNLPSLGVRVFLVP